MVASEAPLYETTDPLAQASEPDALTPAARERPCVQVGGKLACLRSRAEVQAARETAPVLHAASQVFGAFSRSGTAPVFAGETMDDSDDDEDDDDQGEDRDDDQDDDDEGDGDRDDDDKREKKPKKDRGEDPDDDRDDDDRDGDEDDDQDDDDRDDEDREKKPKKDKKPKKAIKPQKDQDKNPKNARGKKPKNDRSKSKCNQGVGNGPEGCDPGNSNHNQPSNDEGGWSPGSPGRSGR